MEVYKHCEHEGINVLTLPAYSPELQLEVLLRLEAKEPGEDGITEVRAPWMVTFYKEMSIELFEENIAEIP